MCGLLYINTESISFDEFKIALDLFAYRGPDDTGVLKINNVMMGHNRLSILDTSSNGVQPFYSKSRRFVVIYNGEIYNYQELSRKYGIKLKTKCDTELLVELFELKGEQMLSELNGMFAFVIYDTQKKEVFAARDRLGIKPLYSVSNSEGDIIAFSSEINALRSLFKYDEIDEVGLRQYKALRTFFRGHTFFKKIKMFPAASYYKNNSVKTYWKLPYEPGRKPPSDEDLYNLINDAVNIRRISDVSVGSYLSGGLDSTIIAGLATERRTWTVGFEDDNEFAWSKIAADRFRVQHHEVSVPYGEFLPVASEMCKKKKEPLCVPNEVLLYLLTCEVAKKNKVILSGEGADELFFGYDRIFSWANQAREFCINEFDHYYSYGVEQDLEIIDYVLEPHKVPGEKCIDLVSRFFQLDHLHGLLKRLDSSTMLCSVEARVPFVDHRIIEIMAGVSFEYRMQNKIVKSPLKRIFKTLVPQEIINRKKVGFPVALGKILNISDATKDELYSKWLDFNIKLIQKA